MKSVWACAATALLLSSQPALPCQVESVASVKEAARDADVVFVGRVLSIRDQLDGSPNRESLVRRVELEVRDVWKGPRRAHLVVWTQMGPGLCGVGFETGKVFIVYAWRTKGTYAAGMFWPNEELRDDVAPRELGAPRWRNRSWGRRAGAQAGKTDP